MLYALWFVLFIVGLYGVLAKRDFTKKLLGLAIMEASAILLIVMLSFRKSGGPAGDPAGHAMAIVAILAAIGLIWLASGMVKEIRAKRGAPGIDGKIGRKG